MILFGLIVVVDIVAILGPQVRPSAHFYNKGRVPRKHIRGADFQKHSFYFFKNDMTCLGKWFFFWLKIIYHFSLPNILLRNICFNYENKKLTIKYFLLLKNNF